MGLQLTGHIDHRAIEMEGLSVSIIEGAAALEDLSDFTVGAAEVIADLVVAMLLNRLQEGELDPMGIIGVNQGPEGAAPVVEKFRHGVAGERFDLRIDEDEGAIRTRKAAVEEARKNIDETAELKLLVLEFQLGLFQFVDGDGRNLKPGDGVLIVEAGNTAHADPLLMAIPGEEPVFQALEGVALENMLVEKALHHFAVFLQDEIQERFSNHSLGIEPGDGGVSLSGFRHDSLAIDFPPQAGGGLPNLFQASVLEISFHHRPGKRQVSSEHSVEIEDHEGKEAHWHAKSSAPVPARDGASGLEDGEDDADECHQKKADGERGARLPGTRDHEDSA